MIVIGDYYFQINSINFSKIEIQNLGCNEHNSTESFNNFNIKKYTFDSNEYKNITIGREKNCSISFEGNKSFSRIHTTFIYDDLIKKWKMKDGTVNQSSTNGTWIFAVHTYEIKNNFSFRVGESKLKISYL